MALSIATLFLGSLEVVSIKSSIPSDGPPKPPNFRAVSDAFRGQTSRLDRMHTC